MPGLVITRKNNQSFAIGDDIKVTIFDCGTGRCKVHIDAPRSIRISRCDRETSQEEDSCPSPSSSGS